LDNPTFMSHAVEVDGHYEVRVVVNNSTGRINGYLSEGDVLEANEAVLTFILTSEGVVTGVEMDPSLVYFSEGFAGLAQTHNQARGVDQRPTVEVYEPTINGPVANYAFSPIGIAVPLTIGAPLIPAEASEPISIESVMEHFEESLRLLRNVDPEMASLVEAYLRSLTPEEIAALGIDTNDLRDLRLFIQEVQEGGVAIENGGIESEYSRMVGILQDLGIEPGTEVFNQAVGQMFALRLRARYGNAVADIILSQVDFSDFSRSQFRTMVQAINKAYLGNRSAIQYLSQFYTPEQITAIQLAVANAELAPIKAALASGEPISESQYQDFQATLTQLQKPINQDLLTALIGPDYATSVAAIQSLEAQLESRYQESIAAPDAPAPAPAGSQPPAPVNLDIKALLMGPPFNLTEAQAQQVIDLLNDQSLSKEVKISQLTELLGGFSVDINDFKAAVQERVVQTVMANPVMAQTVRARIRAGVAGLFQILSEIGQECGQEGAQNWMAQAFGITSPATMFLTEFVVEPEFAAAIARGQFGACANMLAESMPMVGAGMVGAGTYNLILDLLGVSRDDPLRSTLPQVSAGVLSAMTYAVLIRLAASQPTSWIGQFFARIGGFARNPFVGRALGVITLIGPVFGFVGDQMGERTRLNYAAAAASSSDPDTFRGMSFFLGQDATAMLMNTAPRIANFFNDLFGGDSDYYSDPLREYREGVVENVARAEGAGRGILQDLAHEVLEYIVAHPMFLYPELYQGEPLETTSPNPDHDDPEYFDGLLANFTAQAGRRAENFWQFDPSLVGTQPDPATASSLPGADPLGGGLGTYILDYLTTQVYTDLDEIAYMMLVGINQGAIDPASELGQILIQMGLMNEDGTANTDNEYVQRGQALYDQRGTITEHDGLVLEIMNTLYHYTEALEMIDRVVAQARAYREGTAPPLPNWPMPPEVRQRMEAGRQAQIDPLNVSLPEEMLDASEPFALWFTSNSAALMDYLLASNQADIARITEIQQRIYDAFEAVSIAMRAAGQGQPYELDFTDPHIQIAIEILFGTALSGLPSLPVGSLPVAAQ